VILIGTSGWQYADWKPLLYPDVPQKRWLERHAEAFATVEVNNAFYRLPKRETFEAWRDRTPDDYVVTVKASRYLTHIRRLKDVGDGVARFYEAIAPLVSSGKLGPVLWQLPANFKRDEDRLVEVLELLPAGRHCFEFRDESWFTGDVFEILRQFGIALVYGDHPERPWQPLELTTDWTFIRFHYGHRGRRGNYSETELREWAARLRDVRSRAEVFAYFNNDWEAFAPRNAQRLRSLLDDG